VKLVAQSEQVRRRVGYGVGTAQFHLFCAPLPGATAPLNPRKNPITTVIESPATSQKRKAGGG